MRAVLLTLILLMPICCCAQNGPTLYKGTVDTRSVTLYLNNSNGCGVDNYEGIYRYEGISKWLLLSIDHNEKGAFCMVEHGLTGLLLVTLKGETLEGVWLSPDRKKTLPVKLKKVTATPQQFKELEQKQNDLNYEYNDC